MAEKLEGKGTNAERLSALEASVNRILESTEAHRAEVTRAIADLTLAIKKTNKKNGKDDSGSSTETESDEEGYSDNSDRNSQSSRNSGKGNRKRNAFKDCRKLEIPIFNGGDVHGWIYRIERYFEVQEFSPKDQLKAVSICLEGAPLSWYRWHNSKTPFNSWKRFKRKLLERFQSSHGGSIQEQFLDIQQEGSVREYVDRFERFAGQLERVPESIQESTFIKGLKPDVRSAVRIGEPESLAQAIRMAIRIDENRATVGVTVGTAGSGSTRLNSGVAYKGTPVSNTKVGEKKRSGGDFDPGGFMRLTAAELADKRAHGICFRCDGKFTPGHKCPSKTLQVLLVDGDEGGGDNEEVEEHAHFD